MINWGIGVSEIKDFHRFSEISSPMVPKSWAETEPCLKIVMYRPTCPLIVAHFLYTNIKFNSIQSCFNPALKLHMPWVWSLKPALSLLKIPLDSVLLSICLGYVKIKNCSVKIIDKNTKNDCSCLSALNVVKYTSE